MSFLNQLKTQANALQVHQERQHAGFAQNVEATERACQLCFQYLQDLARQLNVILPAGSPFSLDGRTLWPPMKLAAFRTDARKKTMQAREVVDYVAMGWDVLPQTGGAIEGSVTVNFPPDLERVQSRLAFGWVKHDKVEVRHPAKNTLQAIRFDYQHATRGNVTVTPNHEQGQLMFRLANVNGFGVTTVQHASKAVTSELLDELAKLVVNQPSRFC